MRAVVRLALSLAVLSIPVVAAGAQAREVVARAASAMGGEAALRGVRSTSLVYQRVLLAMGQAETPDSPPRPQFFSGETHHDYAGNRRRIVDEARPAPNAVMRFSQVLAGGVVHNDNSGGLSGQTGAAAVAAAERLMRHSPERLLLAALDRPAALRTLPPRRLRGEVSAGVRYASGADTIDLWFDRGNGLLLATEVTTDDAVLGDRRTVTMFTRWTDAGSGVKLPRQVDVRVNDLPLSHTTYIAARVNAPIADSLFAIPDSVARATPAVAASAQPERVVMTALASGVWHATGGSHHSLVVEQGNSLLLVEAPTSAARTRAVLDTLRSQFGAKRVAGVVMSHHHWDHSAGIRTVLAAGLPVVAHQRNVAFVRGIGSAPKTIAPDALSRKAAAAAPPVSDSLVLEPDRIAGPVRASTHSHEACSSHTILLPRTLRCRRHLTGPACHVREQ